MAQSATALPFYSSSAAASPLLSSPLPLLPTPTRPRSTPISLPPPQSTIASTQEKKKKHRLPFSLPPPLARSSVVSSPRRNGRSQCLREARSSSLSLSLSLSLSRCPDPGKTLANDLQMELTERL
ncbi:uncharacterized protein ARB_03001 [Trichophyton benhamiae CBS 112371]|uniref:Uncharacterized protein n=1 Tax=Arthroderma benhamiae (strain ATCC MYA-4681 / CBS 112371) TaxID=663331 RepID=D4B3G3_ARTBC|nr:uncharacterized protein ARB_03001 [Trichophyton benhamiae CBS 112371]EFE29661.1 hypothetical protein ARB_03001 [Trichophyton benhamiae CBS 112371]